MSAVCEVVPATMELAVSMAPRMREADGLEVYRARRWSPLQALQLSISVSMEPKALLIDGAPAAMWGVEPVCVAAGVGVGWLLGAEELTRHPVMFWQLCKQELEEQLQCWQVIFNWIDAEYAASLRWAKRLGFEVDEPKPFGPDGNLFCCAAIVR